MPLPPYVRHAPRHGWALAAMLVLLLPAGALPVYAQAAPTLTDSLTWDPAVRRGVLPNGVRRKRSPVVPVRRRRPGAP